jgi:hypothetical protein
MRSRGRFAAIILTVPILVGCAAPGPSVTPAPPAQTASPTRAATPGVSTFDDLPPGSLVPGAYALDAYAPLRILFTVPEGWSKLIVPTAIWDDDTNDNLNFMRVDNIYRDPCASNLGLQDPPVGPSVDELVVALGRVPGLAPLSPVDTAVSGFPGTHVVVNALKPWTGCTGDTKLLHVKGLFDTPAPDPANHHELWIVDVAGQRLVIGTRTAADAASDQMAELRRLVESVRIEP